MFDVFEHPIAIPFPGMDSPVQIYPLTGPVAALAIGFGVAAALALLLAAQAFAGSRRLSRSGSVRRRGLARARAALAFALRESLRYRGIAWSSAEAAGSRP